MFYFIFIINYIEVFLFYYLWGATLFVIFKLKNIIEYLYLEFNHPSIILKREFKDLGFLEKLFLVLFYRHKWFENSIANIFDKKSIFNYRRKNYPLIFFFHMYYGKTNYKFDNLNFLIKQFNYFKKFKFKKIHFFEFKFFKIKYKFINFLILQKLLYNRYYNLCSSVYFSNYSIFNTLKLNWLFYIFLLRSNDKFVIYSLNKYNDWYKYNFNTHKYVNTNIVLTKEQLNYILYFQNLRARYFNKIYKFYNNNFKKLSNKINLSYKNIYLFKFSLKFFNKINLTKLNTVLPIRFSESSVNKNINYDELDNYNFFYLRKNRIFNKSRYSRNRQLYRTGVYWCLWLNVMLVYSMYFVFYRFTFNFGYLWWGILIVIYSTIFSRALKYNFHNIHYLQIEFLNLFKWVGYLFVNLKFKLTNILINFLINSNLLNFFSKNVFYKLNLFFEKINSILIMLYIKWLNKNHNKFIFIWEGLKEKDTSIFRYKSIINWFNQLYKMIII